MGQRNILNVKVDFPYDPYTMQLSMMTRIIDALNNNKNCLLESPTGTGKTMALLCSSLAWLQAQKEDNKGEKKNIPKIYFGTRTHKQIGQVVREMSRSSYKSVPMSILSSRKQSCVNNHILDKVNIDDACKEACKSKQCAFKLTRKIPAPSTTWDMESMKVELKKKLVCPYFQTRFWGEKASIIFCPYSYIINPSIRANVNINLKNAIVILDEGHNIEDICREGTSTELTLAILNDYKYQFLHLINTPDGATKFNMDILQLINTLSQFIDTLASRLVFASDGNTKMTWDSREAVALMIENNLGKENIQGYKTSLNRLIDDLKMEGIIDEEDQTEVARDLPKISASILFALQSSLEVFEYMLNENQDDLSDFRLVVTEGESFIDKFQDIDFDKIPTPEVNNFLSKQSRKRKSVHEKRDLVLSILCMNPGIIFKDIAAQTHSIILASGTLAPLSSFQRELSCNFDTSLEAAHVVKCHQTMVASVGCGPRGVTLNATYKNVETYSFQDELGSLILQCCKTVPYGVLCFVASFQMIDKLFKRWQVTKLVGEIQKHKTVVIEPRNNSDMKYCMEEYYKYLDKGALMLAVYRGKVSEGMDFSDNAARLVIAVGIPYPSTTDFKVNLKKEYNDKKSQCNKGHSLSGHQWYSIQAYRALNQALGRCIRHSNDWGAMVMVDERFSDDRYNQGFCKWIRARKNHFSDWNDFISSLDHFTESHLSKVVKQEHL